MIQRRQLVGRALTALAALLVVAGCGVPTPATGRYEASPGHNQHGQAAGQSGSTRVEIPHLHGLGFSADGQQLIVPAHDGLRIFADGKWHVPDLPAHDYMGFAPADNGFYSSGHPQPGSALANPLGLVKSTDGGKTLRGLGFEGQSDFHLLGVGYRNHAIYVLNPAPNPRLSVGLHYTLDEGKTWKQSAAGGLPAEPIQIAVHPVEANVVALATEAGLFLSSDHGATFERIALGPVTAATFSPDGARLVFGATTLSIYDVRTRQMTTMQAPEVDAGDAIGYIALNPLRSEEVAIATLGRDLFRSTDGGQSWQSIARDGVGT
jgi:hypothetical protein